jgi:hypothetical protein
MINIKTPDFEEGRYVFKEKKINSNVEMKSVS